ncbi:MAG: dTMP kinase [Bacteroidota bacterium]|nr:dTMP kinase [Bacteroidota bacterium]
MDNLFITFEGIDLCGKSTQARLLFDFFKKKKKKVIFVREPGGTFISEKIRNILLDKSNHKMFALTEFLLFSASRQQLTEEVIKPHLRNGFTVICDRYYDSSTAYQGYGGKLELKTVLSINKTASGGLEPDITFLVDIDLKTTELRRRIAGKSRDRMEQKETAYFKKVAEGYRTIAKNNRKRVITLNGNQEIDVIHNEITDILSKKLK